MINVQPLSEMVSFLTSALVDMVMVRSGSIMPFSIRMMVRIRKKWALSIQKLTKLKLLLMGSEALDGIGNGCGCTQLGSVNLNSMPTIILLPRKIGLDSILVHWMANPKISYFSMEKCTQSRALNIKLTKSFKLEKISPLRNFLINSGPQIHKWKLTSKSRPEQWLIRMWECWKTIWWKERVTGWVMWSIQKIRLIKFNSMRCQEWSNWWIQYFDMVTCSFVWIFLILIEWLWMRKRIDNVKDKRVYLYDVKHFLYDVKRLNEKNIDHNFTRKRL